jgi:uncharacterized membrane protein
MTRARLEAFSDGVIAILITIMVLELKIPHGSTLEALRPILPIFMAYVLSFTILGIYWNNHHHMFHVVDHVNGAILWANLHLLFWLSLIPVTTGWMGDNALAPWPTAVYGVVLWLSGIAYNILVRTIIRHEGPNSRLAQAVKRDVKGKASIAIYFVALPLAFVRPWIAQTLYALVAMMWLVPDRRIESRIQHERHDHGEHREHGEIG